jgi:hypothetical protein
MTAIRSRLGSEMRMNPQCRYGAGLFTGPLRKVSGVTGHGFPG